MRSTGRCAPVPCRRATRLPLRELGPNTRTLLEGKPALRRRSAMASAAIVVLPTESVVLISINCLKMSRDNCRVPGSIWASRAGAENTTVRAASNKVFDKCRCITALYQTPFLNRLGGPGSRVIRNQIAFEMPFTPPKANSVPWCRKRSSHTAHSVAEPQPKPWHGHLGHARGRKSPRAAKNRGISNTEPRSLRARRTPGLFSVLSVVSDLPP